MVFLKKLKRLIVYSIPVNLGGHPTETKEVKTRKNFHRFEKTQ